MTFAEAIKILHIKADFDPKELKKAYRRRAIETHPDKGGKHGIFLQVKEAYEFLLKHGPKEKIAETGSQFNVVSVWARHTTISVDEVIFGVHGIINFDSQLIVFCKMMLDRYMEQTKTGCLNNRMLAEEILHFMKMEMMKEVGVNPSCSASFYAGHYNEQDILECLMLILSQSL